jgi:hypothetical protein|tara:strand:- start:126 stop:509 length:384 start_codon:yes stop_codon:yes gene_type:complete
MKAFGTIKNGKLILNNERRFNDNLNIFEGEEIEIRIKVRTNNRTTEQNSLYWKWINIMSEETGFTKEEMHELVKYKFLKRTSINNNGVEEVKLKSTTSLTVKEFTKLMDDVLYWSNNTLNINLPTYE